MPCQGIYQQMYWSGDGKRVCGTANMAGRSWNIVGHRPGKPEADAPSRGGVEAARPTGSRAIRAA